MLILVKSNFDLLVLTYNIELHQSKAKQYIEKMSKIKVY